jgi:uncharacterized membrane protein YbhN (UPF0104 family)
MGSPPSEPRSKLRFALGVVARVAVTALVFGYLFSRIDGRAVAASVSRIPAIVALLSVGSLVTAVALGMVRWRALLVAGGASSFPSWLDSLRFYLVGMFYNLLPGAVGGDVYRGYATRSYFADGAATRSVGVVFVERVCGFAGLLVLAALATLASPLGNRLVLIYSGLGLCAALGAMVTVAVGRRLSARLPGRFGKLAASLPIIDHPAPLIWALLLSVLTHVAVSMTGFVVIDALAPKVTFIEGMAVFPLGTLAAFFPLTVAGAGARDTALVVLLGNLGVSRADALATSLSMLACNLLVSGLGGLVQLRGRLPSPASVIEP